MLHLDIAEKQKPGNPRCAFVVRADDSAPPWLLHLHLHLRPLLHLRPFPFLLLRLLLRLRLAPVSRSCARSAVVVVAPGTSPRTPAVGPRPGTVASLCPAQPRTRQRGGRTRGQGVRVRHARTLGASPTGRWA